MNDYEDHGTAIYALVLVAFLLGVALILKWWPV